ncbi:hypothetical protein N9R27_01255 [Flavobacteriaceae bacterium]|nr:hypothetical protein [Flavobacteriaceae bacterium]
MDDQRPRSGADGLWVDQGVVSTRPSIEQSRAEKIQPRESNAGFSVPEQLKIATFDRTE